MADIAATTVEEVSFVEVCKRDCLRAPMDGMRGKGVEVADSAEQERSYREDEPLFITKSCARNMLIRAMRTMLRP